MVGETITHYKITEKIGQGGMGEVYRATDTKLNRTTSVLDNAAEQGNRAHIKPSSATYFLVLWAFSGRFA